MLKKTIYLLFEMPEGPEVLTIVDQLDFYLVNKVVKSADFTSGKYEDNHPKNFDIFVKNLPLKIEKVFCKGKLIVFKLYGKNCHWWIFNSLRMTGCWEFRENENHSKFKIEFFPNKDNGVFDINSVFYSDTRGFGTFEFINKESEKNKRLNSLAKGFIGIDEYLIDYESFFENIKKCKTSFLVSKLRDQKIICSGIGNYLISEILYDSGLHPEVRCSELTREDVEKLFSSCFNIIKEAYENGGNSIQDYTDIHGDKGSYGIKLKVYGKRGGTDPYGNKVLHLKKGSSQTIWYVPGLQRKKEITQ